jgi:hypothetical protein
MSDQKARKQRAATTPAAAAPCSIQMLPAYMGFSRWLPPFHELIDQMTRLPKLARVVRTFVSNLPLGSSVFSVSGSMADVGTLPTSSCIRATPRGKS